MDGRPDAAGRPAASISVDYLGEDISQAAEAETTVQAYLSLLAPTAGSSCRRTGGARRLEVSIKLSALGQSLPGGEELALVNARTSARRRRRPVPG